VKVVILHPPMYPVNHELFTLLGEKVDLTVYCYGEHPKLHPSWSVRKFENTNYRIVIFGSGAPSFRNQFNPRLFFNLASEKPDVVISIAFWFPTFFASVLKQFFKFKLLISTDAISATERDIPVYKKWLRAASAKNIDGFISASELTTYFLNKNFKGSPIYQSLQVIDFKKWRKSYNDLPSKTFLRRALKIPLNKKVILGVGAFNSNKNWTRVFSQMYNLPDCIFVLIGNGKLKEEYKKYIQDQGLTAKVMIIGRKEGIELQKYFKAADLFVLPTKFERFGYVVVEALSSNLPVICTKFSGASTLIECGINGYAIDPANDFSDEINSVIADLKGFSKRALVSVENCTLENKALEYFSVLERVYYE
jgi:glycosyltransferase involved in cell wall biosynthesis